MSSESSSHARTRSIWRAPHNGSPRAYAYAAARFAYAALRRPLVVPALLWLWLFHRALKSWDTSYHGGILWEPAFPRPFARWALALAVTPFWAGTQLAWLLFSAFVSYHLRHRRARGRVYDQYVLLVDGEAPPEQGYAEAFPRERRWFQQSAGWYARAAVYAIILFLGAYGLHKWDNHDDVRFRPALRQALAKPRPEGYGRGEKLFIAAMFFNNEAVLPTWGASLLAALAYFGPANVYVSIVESGSTDASPALLEDLARRLDALHVPHRVLVRDTAVKKPAALEWAARINFLAALRNQVLEPLTSGDIGSDWDRVVFSNDVFVAPEGWVELLETAGGEYDMACALDFNHFGLYDAWVIRDSAGALVSGLWPYFVSGPSRRAIVAGESVPVFSCWNGLAAIRAEPFLPPNQRANKTLADTPLQYPLPAAHPLANDAATKFVYAPGQEAEKDSAHWTGHSGMGRGVAARGGARAQSPREAPALRFRASEAGECHSSESFLVPYDMRRVYGLERIYVNGRVIVGYTQSLYLYFAHYMRHPAVRWFVERVWAGRGMLDARMYVGQDVDTWWWDGVECMPWW